MLLIFDVTNVFTKYLVSMFLSYTVQITCALKLRVNEHGGIVNHQNLKYSRAKHSCN